MTGNESWKTLATGESADPVVLAVDFDITGRPEARFSDLVTNLKLGVTMWETVPPPVGSGVAATGTGYVDHWAAALEQDRPRVHAVMGFCAGSVYAAELLTRVRAWQMDEPVLLMFDPELVTSQTLLWQFHKVTGFMSSLLSETELVEARKIGERAYEDTNGVVELKEKLIQLIEEFGHTALMRAGLDEVRRTELFQVFSAFLDYLAAAGDIDPTAPWRSGVAFSSTSPLSGLRAMRATGVEVPVAREVVCDVDHGSMLADKKLAAEVSAHLSVTTAG